MHKVQCILPAYLWPPYPLLIDQILMVGEDEFLSKEDSLPVPLLPATGSAAQNPLISPGQNPLANQNPLSNQNTSGNQIQNPLTRHNDVNPLSDGTNPLTQPVRPVTETSVRGRVTLPQGFSLDRAVLTVCPMTMQDSSDYVIGVLEPDGSYNVPLSTVGEYMVMVAIDADMNNRLNNNDYLGYQLFYLRGRSG